MDKKESEGNMDYIITMVAQGTAHKQRTNTYPSKYLAALKMRELEEYGWENVELEEINRYNEKYSVV